MKRLWAAAACAAAIGGLTACERAGAPEPASESEVAATPGAAPSEATGPAPTATPTPPTPTGATVDGAPAFAALYPGGTLEGEPVIATGPAGPGGLVTYFTEADPETVIAFHRARAEAEGLSSVMAMNQGEARAYGAARDAANLQVVASPAPDGRTSVQLSWSAGG